MERFRDNKIKFYVGFSLAGLFFIIASLYTSFSCPPNFPIGSTFVVNENESLKTISNRLEERNIVSSALMFRALVSFTGRDRHVQLGVYELPEKLSLREVVKRFTTMGPNHPLVKVTIPEGSTVKETIDVFLEAIPALSEEKLTTIIEQENADGKLFPSTYFLLPSATEEKVVKLLLDTFQSMYQNSFAFLIKPKNVTTDNDIISLAAILEGEAKTVEDMQIISGILQKRLAIKMPLQVDVAKETYKSRGLPGVPINNPGKNAIHAVFNPIETPYLYYITGKDGTMYYAKTYDEHKRNINKYLR
ncbi:MAG: hypothetical protein QG653_19 [Patescibacteria group bacterium]|nr:hypothetical protein [Patescibacteria group bacterium]